jgi:molybdenum cofactor guanylyltransferase
MPLTIAILAGGQSRRFGRDKAALFLPGVLEECLATGLPVCVVGREADATPDVRFLPDDFPGMGPLGGLVTALRHIAGPTLLLPCDLPNLTRNAIIWLVQMWEITSKTTCLVTKRPDSDAIEPLFAVYSPDCLTDAEKLIRSERRAIRGLCEACAGTVVSLPPELAPQLHNVNTPSDLLIREERR